MAGGKYTREDAAKDTNVDVKEVDRVWHEAREDARASGELPKKEEKKEEKK